MSTIIKAGGPTNDARGARASAFNFDDVIAKAEAYLEDVRRQADEIVAQAQREAEQMKTAAAAEARAEAMKDAQKQVRAEAQQLLEAQMKTLRPALDEAVKALLSAKDAWRRRWEEQAISLAAAIAERIIRRELADSPEIAVELVREALELAAGSGKLTLRLNPQDRRALAEHIEPLAAQLANLAPSDIVADPEISPGGCRIDTRYGAIDQQIESQLARIEEELK